MMDSKVLPAQVETWIREMHHLASQRPESGACAVASAMELWLWTLRHIQKTTHEDDLADEQGTSQLLTEALGWLLSARSMVLGSWGDASRGSEDAPEDAGRTEFQAGLDAAYTDLCRAQSARAAGEVGRLCAELVFGHRLHPTWEPSCDGCIQAEEIDALEGIMPGISYGARLAGDVLEADGSHDEKAGPCVSFDGLQGFFRRRTKLDGCTSGAQRSKNRVAQWLADVIS